MTNLEMAQNFFSTLQFAWFIHHLVDCRTPDVTKECEIIGLLESPAEENLIASSFVWNNTPQGHLFWAGMNQLWNHEVRSRKEAKDE
jgi:hypothetical protein